eukprot:TRINITY_DN851_c0_g1_i2.p1 TRINITY_DN851_c0_g1~~TRINITY_DN851_c0_g1_i2.p1  ORF type:complete len:556 (+),score=164.20 TRINITY_DN851_c0_g1_i2:96-1763(+)
MNVIVAVQDYINRMVGTVPGIKVLIMDNETAGMISMVFPQSAILQKEVFLFEKIDQKRESMNHLKAIVFLRPTPENIAHLVAELRQPKYGEYHLFFSNTLKNILLDELAQADEHEVVKEVQEFFADYYAVNTDLASLNLDEAMTLSSPSWHASQERMLEGLSSVLLSLKKRPFVRYSRQSEATHRIAQELGRRFSQENDVFDFRKPDSPPLLLLMDRRDDPVTPLLHQWTYQAMVHELLGIRNNRVDMSKVPGIRDELKTTIMAPDSDQFYKESMYKNFGDLGAAIKDLVDEFQSKSKSNQNIQSIDDMKQFVENYPEFRKMSGNVSKHVAVMSELSRLVDRYRLLEVSELQQELACNHDHNLAFKNLEQLMIRRDIDFRDKLRLVLLYAIRYEDAGRVPEAQDMLRRCDDANPDKIALVPAILEYAGRAVRTGDLLGNKTILSIARSTVKRGLTGVTNIYTQHKPLLHEVLQDLARNRLKDQVYPFLIGQPVKDRPQDVIVFFIGGATYEEALTVSEFNLANPGMRVVLAGTTIHNSETFLQELLQLKQKSALR